MSLSKLLSLGGKHAIRSCKLGVLLNDTVDLATQEALTEITEQIKQNKKVICVTLTESKSSMYEKIIDSVLVSNTNSSVKLETLMRMNLKENEEQIILSVLEKLVTNVSIVCYDASSMRDIRVLLRNYTYDKIVVVASRFDRKIKWRCNQLRKDFKIDISMNMFPNRKLLK